MDPRILYKRILKAKRDNLSLRRVTWFRRMMTEIGKSGPSFFLANFCYEAEKIEKASSLEDKQNILMKFFTWMDNFERQDKFAGQTIDYIQMAPGSLDPIDSEEIKTCPICGRPGLVYTPKGLLFSIHKSKIYNGLVSETLEYCEDREPNAISELHAAMKGTLIRKTSEINV